jgi:hypothetical protein
MLKKEFCFEEKKNSFFGLKKENSFEEKKKNFVLKKKKINARKRIFF